MIKVTMQTGHGIGEDLILPGPGGVFRFSVGETDGARSAIWRVWANRNKSDIYIAPKRLAAIAKMSLHESGAWLMMRTREDMKKRGEAERTPRLLSKWHRPDGQGGWTLGPSICIPERDVVPTMVARRHEDMHWFPKPPEGQIATVRIFISQPDQMTLGFQEEGVFFGGGFTLANGHACLIVATVESPSPELEAWIAAQRDRFKGAMTLAIGDRNPANPRAWIPHDPGTGAVVFWDLAMPRVEPASSERDA